MPTNGWDNVDSFSLCHLYAGGVRDGNATLFLNDRHQVPIRLELSFVLVDPDLPGPLPSEVNQCITWVNFDNEQPLRYLASVTANEYCVFYNNESTEANTIRSVAPQYSFDYAFGSIGSPAAGMQEQISLTIDATDSQGAPIHLDATSASSSFATRIPVRFEAAKRYGSGSNPLTPISVHNAGAAPYASCDPPMDHSGDSGTLAYIKIDDSLFFIHDFAITSEIGPYGLIFIDKAKENASTNQWWNTWIVTEYDIKTGYTFDKNYLKYISNRCNVSSDNIYAIGTMTASFTGQPHEIYFLSFSAYIQHATDDYVYYEATFAINIHDQFGNGAVITIYCWRLPTIKDVN